MADTILSRATSPVSRKSTPVSSPDLITQPASPPSPPQKTRSRHTPAVAGSSNGKVSVFSIVIKHGIEQHILFGWNRLDGYATIWSPLSDIDPTFKFDNATTTPSAVIPRTTLYGGLASISATQIAIATFVKAGAWQKRVFLECDFSCAHLEDIIEDHARDWDSESLRSLDDYEARFTNFVARMASAWTS